MAKEHHTHTPGASARARHQSIGAYNDLNPHTCCYGPRAMGLFRSIEDKHGVEQPGYEPPGDDPRLTARIARMEHSARRRTEASLPRSLRESLSRTAMVANGHANARTLNPVGALLVAAGGAAVLIASFLPIYELVGKLSIFAVHLPEDTLVQQQEWFVPIIGAFLIVGGLDALNGRRRREGWWLAVLTCVAGALVGYNIYQAQEKVAHAHGMAALGLGVYVAGAGVALAIFGAFARSERP